jgi:hypothetical protein
MPYLKLNVGDCESDQRLFCQLAVFFSSRVSAAIAVIPDFDLPAALTLPPTHEKSRHP